MRQPPEPHSDRSPTPRLGLALPVLAVLALGAWWGFPVQDDAYLVRLLKMGGPDLIRREHADRPISGYLIALAATVAGQNRAIYIAIGLAAWCAFAAIAARLWRRLFPEWAGVAAVIAMAVLCPVLVNTQFTTVTTLVPCVLPVGLALGGLLLALRNSGRDLSIPECAAAAVLSASAAAISQYGVATAMASAALLLVLLRWRAAVSLVAGAGAGFLVLGAFGDLVLRKETDPGAQLAALLVGPWAPPLRVLSAAWHSIFGAWARSAADLGLDWQSKSTLLAALLGLFLAGVWLRTARRLPLGDAAPGRRIAGLVAAVVFGLLPAVVIQGWPFTLVYETRFLLPVAVFAACATVAIFLSLARAATRAVVVSVLVFLAADRLVLQAFEARRQQIEHEALGARLRPLVRDADGIVVVVSPDRTGQSGEEVMAKATVGWSVAEMSRLWIVRPDAGVYFFGPRSACRLPSEQSLGKVVVRWPRGDRISGILWDPNEDGRQFEPYYRGCGAAAP